MKTSWTIALTALWLPVPLSLQAADAPPNAKTLAYQTSVSQEQLRGATRRLKEEMALLLGEFGQYAAATAEIKQLKSTLDQLDTVTEKDMRLVVQTLREASRLDAPEAAQGKIIAASGSQKNIQSILRSLADRLALQRDEASIQQRLNEIALRQILNLRRTAELTAMKAIPTKLPWEARNIFPLAKAEQTALQDEVRLAMETLRKLSTNPAATARQSFAKVLETGEKKQIEDNAKQALQKLDATFPEAEQSGQQLLETLKAMIEMLRARQSAEEQSREIASELKDLATKEDRLAKADPARWIYQKANVQKEQEEISARIELAREAVKKLNPEAGAETAKAQETSKKFEETFKEKGFMEKIDNAAKVADAQGELSKKLEAVGEMLEKQADALAGDRAPEGGEGDGQSPLSPEEAAIAAAVEKVIEAQGQMGTAEKQLQNGGDTNGARQRLSDAQKALADAKAMAAEAGSAVPASVGAELESGKGSLGKAEAGAGVGSKTDQERNRWNIDNAERSAEKALKGLQEAANQLAAKAAGTGGEQPGGKSGGNKGNGGTGSPGNQPPEDTAFNAVARLRAGQREALSLLQREKASPEYEGMVQQYIRNLASGDLPTK